MKHNKRNKLKIIELKKEFKMQNTSKSEKNYILLKIKKEEYDILYKLYRDRGKILKLIYSIEMLSKKYKLKRKRKNRIDYLNKIKYINEICKLNNEISKYKATSIMRELYLDYIYNFNKYYSIYLTIFKKIDENVEIKIKNQKDTYDYVLNRLHKDHFGLGLYIRNNFIYKNNDDVKIIFERLRPDDISTELLNGYRFYKLGIFKIFK